MSHTGTTSHRLAQLLDRWEQGREQGAPPSPEDLCRDSPELIGALRRQIAAVEAMGQRPRAARAEGHATATTINPLSHPTGGTSSDAEHDQERPSSETAPPGRVGRYRIERLLGRGGFGSVYLAHDDDLQRFVAVKVPHTDRLRAPESIAEYLSEARIVARLEHPHIVPIYDFGRTDDGSCFLVSRYVAGTPLNALTSEDRLTASAAAELIAKVADALHYAHTQGLVHRDVKPSNVLVDTWGEPYVTDFGLAIEDVAEPQFDGICGTPAYMSPEQARGEGHLVDGRSDVFSLGIVFYELLTGERPFRAKTPTELLRQIQTREPKPPRQRDGAIPKPLERICLKALSKRAGDRYTTASDMAEELRAWLDESYSDSTPDVETPSSEAAAKLPPVIPKGLRSFDATDAGFFLRLMPGPYDRDGVPELLRFWRSAVEERDADRTFRVGVVYGPSGCGKSSAMKAGFLPLLDEDVVSVYIECTPTDTEHRLLKAVGKSVPDVDPSTDLVDVLARLRRRHGLRTGQKILLVLDQFEQWLHGRRDYTETSLLRALRQCDGGRVQAVLMVRDDFWMPIMRFMRELDVPMVQRQNSAAVDLFDVRHARKVLMEFGRAYGCLPPDSHEMTREQQRFLDEAVQHIAEDGLVIPVRLSLLAEMVKSKEWVPSTLQDVGGVDGIGVRFLEESISGPHAPPERRMHQRAIRSILAALLPPHRSELKGTMRSRHELLEATGLQSERDLDEVLQLLDDLHLITPTDPEGAAFDSVDGDARPEVEQQFYQLTHDFLVPSVRHWIERKQLETRRGRAELLLEQRTREWAPTRETRLLPTGPESISLLLFTSRSDRTLRQRTMLRRALLRHGRRMVMAATLILLLIGGTWAAFHASQPPPSPPTEYELLGDFLRLDAEPDVRKARFDALDLSEADMSAAVLAVLPLEEDAEVLGYALTELAKEDAVERAELTSLVRNLLHEGSSEVQVQALASYMEYGDPPEVLRDVRRRLAQPDTGHLTAMIVRYIGALDWEDRPQDAVALMEESALLLDQGSAGPVAAAVIETFDALPVERLWELMTAASKRHSRGGGDVGVRWLERYFLGADDGRREELLRLLSREFDAATEEMDRISPDGEYRVELTSAVACRLHSHVPTSPPLLRRQAFERALASWRTHPQLVARLVEPYTCLYGEDVQAAAPIREIIEEIWELSDIDEAPSTHEQLLWQCIHAAGDFRDLESVALLTLIAESEGDVFAFGPYAVRPAAVAALGRIGASLKEDPSSRERLSEIRTAIRSLAGSMKDDPVTEMIHAVFAADWRVADSWREAAIFPALLDPQFGSTAVAVLHSLTAEEDPASARRAVHDYVQWRASEAASEETLAAIDSEFTSFSSIESASIFRDGTVLRRVRESLLALRQEYPSAGMLLQKLEAAPAY